MIAELRLFTCFLLLGWMAPDAPAEESASEKSLDGGKKRGSLSDRRERVRGDSGKWRDDPSLQVAPSITEKPEKMALDDWGDLLAEKDFQLTPATDTWLIFRTHQLDDNDRVWVERIERDGSEITVVFNQAIWQGYYSKSFTWYGVLGVNLGKLPAGQFTAKWIIRPLTFTEFVDPANRRTSDSKNEKKAEDQDPEELSVAFEVAQPN